MKTPISGTTLKLTVFLNIDTADSATITIKDPYNNIIVNEATMTKEADKIYSYLWTSDEENEGGKYTFIYEVIHDTYPAVKQEDIELESNRKVF